MTNLPCEVVRDLLPSYVDGLTSETTGALVEAHVAGCGACRAALQAMRTPEAEIPRSSFAAVGKEGRPAGRNNLFPLREK